MAREIYKPNHPLSNIHGMIKKDGGTTCVTRKGNMCTGCCTALRITEQYQPSRLLKEEGNNCPAQISGKGCSHIIEENPKNRFWVCQLYHCSGDRRKLTDPMVSLDEKIAASQRLTLENMSCLYNNEINKKDYNKNLLMIPFRI